MVRRRMGRRRPRKRRRPRRPHRPCSRTADASGSAARPSTDVFVAPLKVSGATVTVGAPVNISSSPGYDNQPSFTPDGAAVLFTSVRGDAKQSEIYRYDFVDRRLPPRSR